MISKSIQGEEVPALGLGTGQLTGRECRTGVAHALDLGYRHIDTAQIYGNEEEGRTEVRAGSQKRRATGGPMLRGEGGSGRRLKRWAGCSSFNAPARQREDCNLASTLRRGGKRDILGRLENSCLQPPRLRTRARIRF